MLEIHIKNMVCNRCITAVSNELTAMGLEPVLVGMGVARIAQDDLPALKYTELQERLKGLGFELLDSHKARQIEQIKNLVIGKVHRSDEPGEKINWSKLISEELFHDYGYLSSLFSSVEGITLEQYIIRQKLERVKELLFYDELSLSEIADKMGYSSVAHLSAQFKKITGQTPSEFKKTRAVDMNRNPLDSI